MGFTSCSRVKHPSHLLFETDLPPWVVFQEAQWKASFRARRRMELRFQARASWTLRKYGYMRGHEWTRDDAVLAQKLLELLKSVGDQQRTRLRLGEDLHKNDVYLWDERSFDVQAKMDDAILEYARNNPDLLDRARAVGERLLGEYHLPAVLEALGALIPKEFHPRYDGRKPKAKVCGTLDFKTGVYLNAGFWQVDVGEGQCLVGLGHGLPFRMTKGLLEFFLLVLRRISEKLALPVYVAPHAVGLRIHEVEDLELLQLKLRTWKSWPAVAAAIQECQQLFVPVVLENTSHSKDLSLIHI